MIGIIQSLVTPITGSLTPSFVFGTAIQANNDVFLIVIPNGGATVSVFPTGATLLYTGATIYSSPIYFVRIPSASASGLTTFSFTQSSLQVLDVFGYEIAGSTGTLDVTAAYTQSAGTPALSSVFTTTQNSEYCFCVSSNYSGGTLTAGQGWSALGDAARYYCSLAGISGAAGVVTTVGSQTTGTGTLPWVNVTLLSAASSSGGGSSGPSVYGMS